MSYLLEDVHALLDEDPRVSCSLDFLHCPGYDSCCNFTDSLVQDMSVCYDEVIDELQIFEVCDGAHAASYHLQELRKEIHALDTRNEVLVTCDGLQGVNGLESYGLVFTLEIYAPVEEHDGLSEGLWLVLEEHINEITKKE